MFDGDYNEAAYDQLDTNAAGKQMYESVRLGCKLSPGKSCFSWLVM